MTETTMFEPWKDEPTQANFQRHGYKCAMVRGPGGHWCGYVAVPKTHPWHGKGYSDSVTVPQSVIDREIDIDKIGAINFLCASVGLDIENQKIDIVLAVDVHGGLTYSEGHRPSGQNRGIWWFGFDCAHSGDLCPEYKANGWHDGMYRDFEYVKDECGSLAKQLKAFS